MPVQSKSSQNPIDQLPRIREFIKSAADLFDANRIEQASLLKIRNSHTPIAEMTGAQIEEFQDELVGHFKGMGWIANH